MLINQRVTPWGKKRHAPADTTTTNAMGNINFQAKFINWSMRKRGESRVPR